MKILYVAPSIAPKRGGPSQAVIDMAISIQDLGESVDIVTTNENDISTLDLPLYNWITYKGTRIKVFPRITPPYEPIRRLAPSPTLHYWLMRHVANYDIIHITNLFTHASLAAAWTAQKQGIPYVIRPAGVLGNWSMTQKSWKKKVFLELIGYELLKNAADIHCTSKQEEQDVKQLLNGVNSFVLPLGVNKLHPVREASQRLCRKYDLDTEIPRILFFSRIHPKKGLEILIEALSILKDQKFALLLAGDGEKAYLQKIKKMLELYGIATHVKWIGFIEGEDKNLLLQGSDIFVLPSYAENFGIAVVEAMSVGLPIIITPGIEISETIRSAQAGIISDLDPSSLALHIDTLLSSPSYREKLSKNAIELIEEQFLWPKIGHQLVEKYRSILKKIAI